MEDLKTLGIVLRRTNYGEADRILNILTPEGKISAMARGVRKARSKLAGGVEMFTLAELTIHRGRGELGIITGARMKEHYEKIVRDYERMEAAAEILKKVGKVAERMDAPEFFEITRAAFSEINNETDVAFVKSWFLMNLRRISGEEANLCRDVDGEKLAAEKTYDWDFRENAFFENPNGKYSANEIKMLRLMTTMQIADLKRVRAEAGVKDKVYDIIKKWES